jgi:hypothetical protein
MPLARLMAYYHAAMMCDGTLMRRPGLTKSEQDWLDKIDAARRRPKLTRRP